MEDVLHLLPIAPWARGPLGVMSVAVSVLLFLRWLPTVLIEVDANWRRFGSEILARDDLCLSRPAPAEKGDWMAGFLFKIVTVEGDPAEPPTVSVAVPNWKPGDTIHSRGKTLRVAGLRDEDADQPAVLVVEQTA